MGEELTAQYFSIGSRWAYLNRDLGLNHVSGNTQPDSDPLMSPIVLTGIEEQALMLASEAGQTLNETLQRWPEDLLRRSPQARFDLAKQACIHSENLGLPSLADKVRMLMLAAGEDDAFFSSTRWVANELSLKSGQTTLTQLLESTL